MSGQFNLKTRSRLIIALASLARAKTNLDRRHLLLGKENVSYIEYNFIKKNGYKFLDSYDLSIIDPVDFELERKLEENGMNFTKLETKLFILSDEKIRTYFLKKDLSAKVVHQYFYEWVKKELNGG